MVLTVVEEETLAQPEAVAQADSRALALRLLEAWGDTVLLTLGAVPLCCALPLAALLALPVPSRPLEGVRVGALRLAPGVAVAPPGGGDAVAALALGKKGEDEGEMEVLTAALTLRHAE